MVAVGETARSTAPSGSLGSRPGSADFENLLR